MSTAMALLATCKYEDCEGDISAAHVKKVIAIPKAPHHLAFVAQCPNCGRPGQYVVERHVLEDLGDPTPKAASKHDRIMRAALIELDVVEGADDLIALWSSLHTPPMVDGLQGKCTCKGCKEKRYV
jgi:hypothetical protein